MAATTQADRKTFIDDVTVFTVGGIDFVARIKDATYADEVSVIENSALKDAAAFPMPGKRAVKIEFDEAVEASDIALTPGVVYVVNLGAADPMGSKSGPALLVSRSHKYGEDLSRSFQFQFQGLPT